MKKILSLILVILCLFSLISCGEKTKNENKKDAFTPLFRFTVKDGSFADTRLFYLKESDGFLYLHKGENGGFTGGFVSPSRSVSVENLVKGAGDLSSLTLWEKEKDLAYLLTENELILLALKNGGAHATALPDIVKSSTALPYNALSFLSQSESLVLLHPVDFAQTYVLCDKSGLPDFGTLLATTNEGKKIWYTKKNTAGNYTGIGFFEYGNNLPLGNRDFAFDSYEKIGSNAVLFTSAEDDRTTYRYLNLATGEEKTYFANTPFGTVTCDESGTILCGTTAKGEGGLITVIDLDTGKEKGSHTIDYGTPGSLALNKDASTLLISFGKGKDQILATLDLTRF